MPDGEESIKFWSEPASRTSQLIMIEMPNG